MASRPGVPPAPCRVLNLTRGTVLADRVEVAGSTPERMRGLLGRTGLEEGEGLVLPRAPSIHTFGMRFAIDVVFCTREGRVAAIRREVPPGRLLFSWRGRAWTLELPPGAAGRRDLAVGDHLSIE